MTIPLRAARAAATLAVVVIMTACASHEDPALLAAQQTEVNALLAANAAFAARNYKTAFDGYLPWAQKGDDFSEARIAYMYYMGLGVAKDEIQAQHWYEKAAMDGSNQAAIDLGNNDMSPESGAQDYGQAMKWFTLASNRGDLFADVELSILYEHGLGVTKDHDEALHWLNQYVARQDIASGPLHFKYSGGDNIGGFMRAFQLVLVQAAQRSPEVKGFNAGVALLSFHYQDGRASNVIVAKSSGNPAADAAAVNLLQKTLFPPILASLIHMETFQVEVTF